ncbi:hypothetical protein PACTADRAFT_51484 [Pachysolen tannophilus NRRL Y-2460]|uniref:Uncharacterized protein n=1 Tax=Pachysolen tannophilus NRRL Y-2460 TaxID=669874 RepID=A0A1E4TPP1_PACTA|nr:hypothetical protein PACTADRAFT_51484 [Pachysolen tannophilus NRRL Y-2460]
MSNRNEDNDDERYINEHDPSDFLTTDYNNNIRFEMGPDLERGYKEEFESYIDKGDVFEESDHGYDDDGGAISDGFNGWPEFSEWSIKNSNNSNVDGGNANVVNGIGGNGALSFNSSLHQTNLPIIPSLSLNEDPSHFLKTQEAIILSELNETIMKHSIVLSKGHGRINNIRNKILNYLNQLNEIHQAMNEIYNTEKSNRLIILKTFENWENKKKLLLEKINDIKSDKNEQGIKFKNLYTESISIDEEINELEQKLKNLKSKRSLIRNELQNTQSIIESRSSSYIESLQVIENNERKAIAKLSSSSNNGNNESITKILDLPNLTIPTNISTFPYSPYNNDRNSNVSVSAATRARGIENSRFIESTKLTDFSKLKALFGFKDAENNIDNRMVYDDIINKEITSNIDASPILESLSRQVEAIDDQIVEQERTGERYAESSIIWNDAFNNILEMEKTISKSIKNNTNNDDDISRVLIASLENLESRYNTVDDLNLQFVKDAIKNEIITIRKALHIITNDSKYSISLDETNAGINTPSSTISSSSLNRNTSFKAAPQLSMSLEQLDSNKNKFPQSSLISLDSLKIGGNNNNAKLVSLSSSSSSSQNQQQQRRSLSSSPITPAGIKVIKSLSQDNPLFISTNGNTTGSPPAATLSNSGPASLINNGDNNSGIQVHENNITSNVNVHSPSGNVSRAPSFFGSKNITSNGNKNKKSSKFNLDKYGIVNEMVRSGKNVKKD